MDQRQGLSEPTNVTRATRVTPERNRLLICTLGRERRGELPYTALLQLHPSLGADREKSGKGQGKEELLAVQHQASVKSDRFLGLFHLEVRWGRKNNLISWESL